MKHFLTRIGLRVGIVLALALGVTPVMAQVLDFAGDDPEMNQAIENARDSFPEFLRMAETLPVDRWFLKAALETGRLDTSHEHIWTGFCQILSPGQFECAISNQPVVLDLALGQPVTFSFDTVSDWMYIDDAGLIHGAYTTRVMVNRLPPDQAAPIAEQLAPLD